MVENYPRLIRSIDDWGGSLETSGWSGSTGDLTGQRATAGTASAYVGTIDWRRRTHYAGGWSGSTGGPRAHV